MVPESNLNSLLQDGNSFQINLPQHGTQNIKIRTYHIGELVLPTGKLMACDLLIVPDDRYYFKKHLKPGRYPMVISVAEIQPSGDKRIACAKLSLSEKKPIRWELAAINDPDPEGKGVRNRYWVDSGTGCFIDTKAAEILVPLVWKEGFKKDRLKSFVIRSLQK